MTDVKIFNMPDKQKSINSNKSTQGCKDQESIQSRITPNPEYQRESDKLICFTQGSGHDKLVQLVLVNPMSYLTRFYCGVSFARQYINK